MDDLIREGIIIEKSDMQNLAYILQNSNLFFLTGYKVLQSQEKNGFVRCTKILHNGKDKLVYNISKYKPLEVLLPELRPEAMLAIISNLTDVIIEVKNNGFMQCENIAITADKIFVDCNNYKVYLIYLPIDTQSSRDSYMVFESQLKSNIIRAIQMHSNLSNPVILKLCDGMRNSSITIENLKDLVNNCDTSEINMPAQAAAPAERAEVPGSAGRSILPESKIEVQEEKQYESAAFQNQMQMNYQIPQREKKQGIFQRMFKSKESTPQQFAGVNASCQMEDSVTEIMGEQSAAGISLIGIGTPEKCEIIISKEDFLIGKRSDKVDFTILFNGAVSREHCRVITKGGQYFIKDLKSTNGTFLNGIRLNANQPVQIKKGDKIKIANSEFVVK